MNKLSTIITCMEETHLSTKQAVSMVDRIAQATFYDEKESGNDHKGSDALFGVAEYLERIIEKEQDTIFKVMQMNNAVTGKEVKP